MGILIRASVFGTAVGIAAFVVLVLVNLILGEWKLSFLRNGGGGDNLLWLGGLPCLVAAAATARKLRAGIGALLLAAILGTGGGTLATWITFHQLAGMQGLNPLIFSGPFCAAIIAAVLCHRNRNPPTPRSP